MTFCYLDASAWVKRYYHESGSERMQGLFSGAEPRACCVLGVVEVIATLARKRKALEIAHEDFEAKVIEVERDWRSFIQIELSPSVLERAKKAAARLGLRGSDAVHLAALEALGQHLSNSGDRAVLVASDRELNEAAEASGFEVIDPEAGSAR